MVGIDGVVIGDDGSDQIDVPLPDDSTVFKGKTVRLRKEQSMLLLAAIAIEQKGSQVPEEIKNSEFWFVPKVIQKRIDVLGLPTSSLFFLFFYIAFYLKLPFVHFGLITASARCLFAAYI